MRTARTCILDSQGTTTGAGWLRNARAYEMIDCPCVDTEFLYNFDLLERPRSLYFFTFSRWSIATSVGLPVNAESSSPHGSGLFGLRTGTLKEVFLLPRVCVPPLGSLLLVLPRYISITSGPRASMRSRLTIRSQLECLVACSPFGVDVAFSPHSSSTKIPFLLASIFLFLFPLQVDLAGSDQI
ncbi:uncharacterized protein BDW70DRAFT_61247 [Aspergillus foveolatus]|uniref:uncharacterized protein n=1 Tax=Aspergillus foveolatus TaxID=210207 RepID=UPI003CCE53BC